MEKNSDKFKDFTNDVRPHRIDHWRSIFHQLAIPVCLEDVTSVLEFGPGRGLHGAIMKHYGMEYYTCDVADYGAKPDFLYNIKDFPIDKKFDMVCAFQVLEHNPPEDFLPHLKKLRDISNKYVYISMPYYGRWLSFNISVNLPRLRFNLNPVFTWRRWLRRPQPIEQNRRADKDKNRWYEILRRIRGHKQPFEYYSMPDDTPYTHHWFEVGNKGFSKKDIKVMAEDIKLKQIKTFHSVTYPYHYFILFEKI